MQSDFLEGRNGMEMVDASSLSREWSFTPLLDVSSDGERDRLRKRIISKDSRTRHSTR